MMFESRQTAVGVSESEVALEMCVDPTMAIEMARRFWDSTLLIRPHWHASRQKFLVQRINSRLDCRVSSDV